MAFSSRLHWDLRPNRLTELLARKRAAGAGVIDLTESNPTRAGFQYRQSEILEALGDARALLYEPHPAGLWAARESVSSGYYAPRGLKVDPARILLTASTSEAYAYLMKLLADPGDELLTPAPSYPLFEFLAGLESVRVKQYPLIYDGEWSIDLESLARAITKRTRAVVVVNPNNPAGSFIKRRELARLASICREHDMAIISDEVFADYAFAEDTERVESLADCEETLTFSMSGLSKAVGLPQMKLGWVVVGGPERERTTAIERLELVADTYLSVGAPVQHALPRLLAAGAEVRDQIRERTRRNFDVLRNTTQNSACRTLNSEGGWYGIIETPRVRTEEEWALELLDRCDTLTQPGYYYDFDRDALLVVSLLTESAALAEGVHRVLDYVKQITD